jgi:aryl-alcohol dehydrogenase-like predicted oxidoreductase
MDTRPLGPLRVSVIGFGAWGIGGLTPKATSYGETDDAVSRRALHEALDLGITFFDTSSVYGDGRSERLIGELAASQRDRMVIATKGGIAPGYAGYDFSSPALRASLEASLRRLRTDHVDLFQLHNASAEVVGRFASFAGPVRCVPARGQDPRFRVLNSDAGGRAGAGGVSWRRLLPGELQSA